MRYFHPTPDLLIQSLHFNKESRAFLCTLKFQQLCFNTPESLALCYVVIGLWLGFDLI